MAKALVALVALTAVANALPTGFLMAMCPDKSFTNRQWITSIDPTSAATKQLGEDYVQATLSNTLNGGAFNQILGKAQFVGQALTFRDDGTPNPTMNFLVEVDATGDYRSTRLISFGGMVMGVRIDSHGGVFGMEQSTSTTDARLDSIEESGLCNNLVNTTSTSYTVGHMAGDFAGQRFFVSVKNATGSTSLQILDLKDPGVQSAVDMPNAGAARIFMCWDASTNALYSMERLAGKSDTTVFRVDPRTAKSDLVATIPGRSTVADCRDGFLFATGTSSSGATVLNTVVLSSGAVTTKPLPGITTPQSLIFFPQ